jgi:CBS domain-containing protein
MANYELCAGDIMQVEIATILGDLSVAEAARQMLFEGVRSLIVEPRSASDPLAIITYSDIVNRVLAHKQDPEQITVDAVMTKPLITVPPNMPVEYIARLFRQHRIGHVPVVEGDKLIGIVSMTDLVTEIIAENGE